MDANGRADGSEWATAPLNMGEWLTAVRADPDTGDLHVAVALALANGEHHREGVTADEFSESVEELIALGYLEDMFSMDHGGGWEEHMLEFRIPLLDLQWPY